MQDHAKGICVSFMLKFCFLFFNVYTKIFSLSPLGQEYHHSGTQLVNTFENTNVYKDLSSFDQISKY